jgi:hypothetical protein
MTFHQSSSNFGLFQHVICLKYSKFYEESSGTIRLNIGPAKLKLFYKTVIKTNMEYGIFLFKFQFIGFWTNQSQI